MDLNMLYLMNKIYLHVLYVYINAYIYTYIYIYIYVDIDIHARSCSNQVAALGYTRQI